jgi:hypothetical protein
MRKKIFGLHTKSKVPLDKNSQFCGKRICSNALRASRMFPSLPDLFFLAPVRTIFWSLARSFCLSRSAVSDQLFDTLNHAGDIRAMAALWLRQHENYQLTPAKQLSDVIDGDWGE